ncbi:hypothetical protein [Pedobacter sp. CFBP9032]|uniref:hypothetical protein n=1 Tax=Pedobacter sp. CFBP9032 TaxID=3096539 RepID=UPI002A6B2BDD|nr:hypothetical protein [Pedobacter sp. CFBP9032]MDY0906972.1 hypothetical protein [Pedobacter sp. CFBP9032]
MKKFTILMLCIVTLGLASCKKETIVNQALGKTYNRYIEPNQWVQNSNGTYSFTWNKAEFDGVTLDDEGVLVYFTHPTNDNSDVQLPYTFNYTVYSYELFNGGITFDVQDSRNLSSSVRPNYRILVKVVVIPSEFAN